MAVSQFGAFIAQEYTKSPAGSIRSVSRPQVAYHRSPSNNDLDNLQWGQRIEPPVLSHETPTGFELDSLRWGAKLNGPKSPHASLDENSATDAIVHSAIYPPQNRWRLASLSIVFLTLGLNDSATGAQIPWLEEEYGIGYATVSIVFITQACGFLVAAPLVQTIDNLVGRAWLCVIVEVALSIGLLLLSCAPPFPLVVIAFFFIGAGYATFLGSANAFLANMLNGTVIMGLMHGVYGIGGIVAPLIATSLASNGVRWSFFYIIPLLLSACNIPAIGWTFRGFENETVVNLPAVLERTISHQRDKGHSSPQFAQYLKAIKNKVALLGAGFIFFYQGAEVAIAGWVISFLISYRHGSPDRVGNVTSGFWGGITLGRFVLTPIAHKLGDRLSVAVLVVVAAACQLLVWVVPNVISNAVAESLVGLFLGPVYPCVTSTLFRLLPRDMQINSLSFISSVGASGGAFLPFFTGLLSQKLSPVVLHPIVLVALGVMVIAWFLLPKVDKRSE